MPSSTPPPARRHARVAIVEAVEPRRLLSGDGWDAAARLVPDDGRTFDRFGASVGLDGGLALVGSPFHDAVGFGSGSAYLFDADTGATLRTLAPADGRAGDRFGIAAALDGGLALVGAYWHDAVGDDSGAAYVFDAATGQQLAKLVPQDAARTDWFGASVALDAGRAVVGSYFDDDAGTDSGSAYVFDAATGQQLRKLVPQDGAAGDRFGSAVAVSGDRALIGSVNDNGGAGSAYLFDVTTGQQLAKFVAADAAAGDGFGSAVALAGPHVLIGSRGDDDAGAGSGSAYQYEAATLALVRKIVPADAQEGDVFGWSMAIDGGRALIGAKGAGTQATGDGGAVYVFDLTDGAQIGRLEAPDAAGRDEFGYAVALDGPAALVGALADDYDLKTDVGSARLFFDPPEASATLAGGVLTITGTDGPDHVVLANDFAGNITVTIDGGVPLEFASADVTRIDADLLAGDDRLVVGRVLFEPIDFAGGAGEDTLDFEASPGNDDDAVVTASSLFGGGNDVAFAGVETVNADFGFGFDTILVNVAQGTLNGGPRVTNVFGGPGDDRFDIRATPGVLDTVNLFGGEGDDTFAVEPGVVAVPNAIGGDGVDRAVLTGTANADVATLALFLPGAAVPRPAAIVASGAAGAAVFYDGTLEDVEIDLLGGADRADLRGVPAGVAVDLDLGAGDDLARTEPGNQQSFAGADLSVTFGPGVDEARLQAGAGVAADFSLIGGVLIDPRLDLALDLGPDAERVTLIGGPLDDRFTIEPSPSLAVRVEGRAQATADPGDTLDLLPPAGVTPTLTGYDAATGAGTFVFDAGGAGPDPLPVEFVGIETLLDADVVPPTLTRFEFAFETRQEIVAVFSEDVAASVGLGTITVTNLDTGQILPPGDFFANITGGPDFPTELRLRPVDPLPDGNYRATIPAGTLADAAGNVLATTATLDFFVLAGDFNRDRAVNLSDFTILANNFGQSGRTFSQGDANYDGVVNLSDFTVLANRFGATLPPPPSGDDDGLLG